MDEQAERDAGHVRDDYVAQLLEAIFPVLLKVREQPFLHWREVLGVPWFLHELIQLLTGTVRSTAFKVRAFAAPRAASARATGAVAVTGDATHSAPDPGRPLGKAAQRWVEPRWCMQ